MIFVTVGSQMSFDRLVRVVDEWAGRSGHSDVFAQIGPSNLQPRHMEYAQLMSPVQFRDCLDLADTVISHAGMGTIISAVERSKPILVMPRRSQFGETRNDHQVDTAQRFEGMRLVEVAMTEDDLLARLDSLDTWRRDSFLPRGEAGRCATCPFGETACTVFDCGSEQGCPRLLDAVKTFVRGGTLVHGGAPVRGDERLVSSTA